LRRCLVEIAGPGARAGRARVGAGLRPRAPPPAARHGAPQRSCGAATVISIEIVEAAGVVFTNGAEPGVKLKATKARKARK